MRASRVMTKTVHSITPELPLDEAWAVMQKHHVRHLPVMWGEKVAGILSDRDLLLRASRGLSGELHFSPGTVADAMTPRPITALATATVSTLAKLMLERRIDSVPIVNREEGLVGLVTSTDLLELLAEPDAPSEVLPFTFSVRTPGETMSAA